MVEDFEEFSLSVGSHDGFRVLVVRGEVDELTAPELEAALGKLDGAPRAVIVDLTAVSFMSSAGVNVLLRERGAPTALVCPAGAIVSRILEIVEANKTVPVFDSLDQATQSLPLTVAS